MLNYIECIAVFFLAAFLIGMLYIRKYFFEGILYGTVTMLAVFAVLAPVMTALGMSLTLLTAVWGVIVLILGLIGVIKYKRELVLLIRTVPGNIRALKPIDLLICAMIFFQIFICIRYVFLNDNDAYYVGMATTTLDTDTLFKFSPYTGQEISWENYKFNVLASLPVFWAVLSKFFRVNASVMSHTLVPVIFIIAAYILYRQIALYLFKDNKRAAKIFVLIICIFNCFSGRDIRVSFEMLSTCIWQGGSFLYNISLPLIFLSGLKVLNKRRKRRDIVLLIMSLLIGIMSVPRAGLILSAAVLFCLYFAVLTEKLILKVKRKKINAEFIS